MTLASTDDYGLLIEALDRLFHLVVLEVAKDDSCKDFGFNWGSCCCSCTTQNPCCSHALQKGRMVHGMSTTRDGELQPKRYTHHISEREVVMRKPTSENGWQQINLPGEEQKQHMT